MTDLAIIGGSGFAQLADFQMQRRETINTPYGEPSSAPALGRLYAHEAVFLPRHADAHTIPPHQINYRANIWALKQLGVKRIIAFNAVGGISAEFAPGDMALPDQIIDYTWGRAHTFFDGAVGDHQTTVKHIDFSRPYSEAVRAALIAAAKRGAVALRTSAVYAATQGPRLETAAEINRLERDGANIVGMTGMPEAALARELELPYAALAIVVNRAAGRAEPSINMQKIAEYLKVGAQQAMQIVKNL